MSEIIHERPGVYSSYDASAVVSGGRAVRTVGVAAKAVKGDVGKAVILTGYAAGVAAFGEDAAESPGMSTLLRLLFSNGAATVTAVRVDDVGDTEAYEAAFQVLGREEAQILICDSAVQEVQQALRTAVEEASGLRRERIALVGGDGDSAAELVERVCYLISRHHTYTDIDGMDYQILVEADFLVNLFEDGAGPQEVASVRQRIFRTQSGLRMLEQLYDCGE